MTATQSLSKYSAPAIRPSRTADSLCGLKGSGLSSADLMDEAQAFIESHERATADRIPTGCLSLISRLSACIEHLAVENARLISLAPESAPTTREGCKRRRWGPAPGTPPECSVWPNRIKELRNSRGLTQSQLAILAGIPFSTISHYEAGRQKPRAMRMVALRRALGLRPDDLLELQR